MNFSFRRGICSSTKQNPSRIPPANRQGLAPKLARDHAILRRNKIDLSKELGAQNESLKSQAADGKAPRVDIVFCIDLVVGRLKRLTNHPVTAFANC